MTPASPLLAPGSIPALRESVRGSVVLPGDADYDAARQVWNGAIDRHPAVIVCCEDGGDVAAAVRAARKLGLTVSARGGGHDWDGRAVTDRGLLLNLSGMRRVTVDRHSLTAVVQGGARAGDLATAADRHGLAPVTGTSKAVGLAGLTLGGGYGLLNGEHGLTLDNLLEARIVLATGEEVTASPDAEPDLFWAIRGGGGNFGIVTSARYRVHPLPELLAGLMLFPLSRARDVLRGYAEVIAAAPDALTVMAGFLSGPDTQPLLFLLPAWNGEEPAGEEFMARLTRFGEPFSSGVSRRTYLDVLGLFDDIVVDGRHNEMRTRWLPTLTEEAADVLVAAAATLTSPLSAIVIHHCHGAATRVPAAETAFALRRDHLLVEILASWDAQEPDGDRHRNWARTLSARLEPFSLPGGYANLLGSDEHDRAVESFGPNITRLLEAKRRFDPDNVFHAVPDLVYDKSLC